MTTYLPSPEYLEFARKHNLYVLFEKGTPGGRSKRDFISLVTREGRSVGMSLPNGYSTNVIELPREVFDGFIAASLIEQDRPEDSDGRIFFRLTADVHARAAS